MGVSSAALQARPVVRTVDYRQSFDVSECWRVGSFCRFLSLFKPPPPSCFGRSSFRFRVLKPRTDTTTSRRCVAEFDDDYDARRKLNSLSSDLESQSMRQVKSTLSENKGREAEGVSWIKGRKSRRQKTVSDLVGRTGRDRMGALWADGGGREIEALFGKSGGRVINPACKSEKCRFELFFSARKGLSVDSVGFDGKDGEWGKWRIIQPGEMGFVPGRKAWMSGW
jgi:hypothetical protein